MTLYSLVKTFPRDKIEELKENIIELFSLELATELYNCDFRELYDTANSLILCGYDTLDINDEMKFFEQVEDKLAFDLEFDIDFNTSYLESMIRYYTEKGADKLLEDISKRIKEIDSY